MTKGAILLAAGGTGGHLFPAQALAEELVQRGYDVQLATDERVRDYGKSFPASQVHVIKSATVSLRAVTKLPGAVLTLVKGYAAAMTVIRRVKPKAIVGFGGYPSLPPVLAAVQMNVPSLVHEQNAVLGRANGFLSRRVRKVAGSFPALTNMPQAALQKFVFTGNPVRALVRVHAAAPVPPVEGRLSILVFGGSQGARFFSEFMPQVFAEMSGAQRSCFQITQQARQEDVATLAAAYERLGVDCVIAPFFTDLPARMAASHLVVSRSGASTIAELGVIGRPAILIPLPHAIDNDQLRNAEFVASAGAGWCLPQSSLSAKTFAAQLNDLLGNPRILQAMAAKALTLGKPDAAARLADVLENMIEPPAR